MLTRLVAALTVLWLATVGVLALVLVNRGEAADAVGWLVTAVAVLLLVLPVLVRRHDRLALLWMRVRSRLSRASSLPWTLTVTIRGDFSDPSYFDRVQTALVKTAGDRIAAVPPRAVNGLRVRIEGLGLVEAILDDLSESSSTCLTVAVSGSRFAPHEAVEVLEKEIVPLVRAVEASATGPLREQGWTLDVRVPSRNPYLPLYLRDRDPAEIDVFRVSYKEHMGSDCVDLSKDRIRVSATSADGFLALVRDWVTFSGRGVFDRERHA